MKKIVSFLLVAVMIVGIVPTAFAAETDWQNGTIVTYTANQSEAYTVTVPAEMAPGETGTVKLTGTWDSSKTVKVTADSSVVLTNNISGGDAKTLDVTFGGIELKGSNTGAVSATETVSVAGIDNALFGTWSGKFNYYVEVVEKRAMMFSFRPPQAADDDFDLHQFSIQFEPGMTWREFVNSEYNNNDVITFEISGDGIWYEYLDESSATGMYCGNLDIVEGDTQRLVNADDEIIANAVYCEHGAPEEGDIPIE